MFPLGLVKDLSLEGLEGLEGLKGFVKAGRRSGDLWLYSIKM